MRPLTFLPPVAILIILLINLLQHPLGINIDGALFLQEGSLMLGGKIPYVDFVDLNPPLIIYIDAIPALIARLSHTSSILSFYFFNWTVALLSLSACGMLLYKRTGHPESDLFAPLLVGFSMLQLVLIYHFGQREQLMVLCFFPFFLARWLRWNGQDVPSALAAVLGFMAGLGLSIKPYFFIIWAALELYWLLANKRKEPIVQSETVALLLAVLVYACHFFFLPSAMREAYFHRWFPLALNGYVCYNAPLDQLLMIGNVDGSFMPFRFIFFAILIAAIALRKHSSLLAPFVVWTCAGFLVYLVQGKGFFYQCIPMFTGYYLAANVELALAVRAILALIERGFPGTVAVAANSSTALILYLVLLAPALPVMARDSSFTGQHFASCNDLVATKTCPGDYVILWSTNLVRAFPCLVQMQRNPGTRQLIAFPLPMVEYLKNRTTDSQEKHLLEGEESRILQEMADDIKTFHPRLIMIDAYDTLGQINLFAFLGAHDFLNTALKDYRALGMWNGCAAWELSAGNGRAGQGRAVGSQ